MHDSINYGAVLQAYALYKKLYQMNSGDVSIIDLAQSEYIPINIKQKAIKYYLSCNDLFYKKSIAQRKALFKEFLKSNTTLTTHYASAEELKRNPPVADAYVCGSDQVWNCSLTLRDEYFLNFGQGEKKVSYAASLGVDYVPEKYRDTFTALLKKIDYISVRENSANRIIKEITGLTCETVLDPVFLLSSFEWKELIDTPIIKERYILYYHLHSSKTATMMLKKLKKKYRAKVVTITLSSKAVFGDLVVRNAGPLEFLNLYKNALYTVNASFHGTAFSVLFHKPFISQVYGNSGDRVRTLLEDIGLEERIFSDTVLPKQTGDVLNWEKVQQLLNNRINSSENFLRKALYG